MANRIDDAGLLTVLKDIRKDSVEVFNKALIDAYENNEGTKTDNLDAVVGKAVDHAISNVVGTVYDYPDLYVERLYLERESSNDLRVTAQFREGLAELYLNEVST